MNRTIEKYGKIAVVFIALVVLIGVYEAGVMASGSGTRVPYTKQNYSAIGTVSAVSTSTDSISLSRATISDGSSVPSIPFDLSSVSEYQNAEYAALTLADVGIGDTVIVQGLKTGDSVDISRVIDLSWNSSVKLAIATTTTDDAASTTNSVATTTIIVTATSTEDAAISTSTAATASSTTATSTPDTASSTTDVASSTESEASSTEAIVSSTTAIASSTPTEAGSTDAATASSTAATSTSTTEAASSTDNTASTTGSNVSMTTSSMTSDASSTASTTSL